MTDKEKAIVMAHTGICMLTGNKFQIFHKYVEDIMGRPIMTHEIGWLADTIKEKSKADFMALCADESNSENPNKWIPVSERLPEDGGTYLVTTVGKSINGENNIYLIEICWLYHRNGLEWYDGHLHEQDWDNRKIIAWMPLPEPYKTPFSDGDECVDKALMPLIDEGYEPDIQIKVGRADMHLTEEEMKELNGLAASMGLYDDKNPCKRAVILGKAIKALEQEPCDDVPETNVGNIDKVDVGFYIAQICAYFAIQKRKYGNKVYDELYDHACKLQDFLESNVL